MNLYHNSATVDATYDTTRGMGFNLGPGWTTSYSSHILDEQHVGNRTVIADDGTRDFFTPRGAGWDGPPGVHDKLTFDDTAQVYRLTHKDQSYHEYDNEGLLIAIVGGDAGRFAFNRAGRSDKMADSSVVSGKCR